MISDKLETYFWKRFECEICRESYPLSVYLEDLGVDIALTTYELPIDQNYIVLESQKHMGVNQTQRMIHIIKPEGDEDDFSIGRGEGVEITLNDITSSDIHAYLMYKDGVWTLEDNNSMYGTTILMKV